MATQPISHPSLTKPTFAGRISIAPSFKTVSRMAGRVAAVVEPIHPESSSMDGEEVESRLAALNRRYETAANAVAEAGAEYQNLRGSQSRSPAAIESQRRRWIHFEQLRRKVGAAIERLEDFVT